MYHKLLLVVVLLLPVFGITRATTAQAQTTTLEPVQLINIPIAEELIISVPDDWLLWQRLDYETLAEADAAVNALFRSVEPSVTFNISTGDVTLFYALKPDLTNPIMTFARVDIIGLELGAALLQVPPEDVKAEDIMILLNQELWGSGEVNGRSTAYGNIPIQGGLGIMVTTVFPDQNLLAQVQFLTSATWGIENLYLITLVHGSLRASGEDIDLDYIADLMDGTPVPDGILLPPADIVETDVSETAPDSPATAEAEAVTITCVVSASSNVNLRGGPGTAFSVVGSLAGDADTAAIAQATGSDGQIWWQLESGAWVRSDVVTETGACDLLPTVTAP